MAERRLPQPRPEDQHDLLPWYLNGTLGESEAAEFRKHLQGCDACTSEMRFLKGLQGQLGEHGEVFLRDHPSAEDLVAFVRGELDPQVSQPIRRHLELCATCTTEAGWIRGDAVAELPARATLSPAAAPRRGPQLFPWALAAAAGLAGFLIAAPFRETPRDPLGSTTALVRMLPLNERAAGEPHRVTIPAGQDLFLLVTEVDFAEAAFPVEFEIRDAAGTLVRSGSISSTAPYDGRVFIDCSRSAFPDGDYSLNVTPVGYPSSKTAFRVVSD